MGLFGVIVDAHAVAEIGMSDVACDRVVSSGTRRES
jgi:hypothetical protein